MKILVIGATGQVGSKVAQELTQRGHTIRVLTRDPAKARSLGTSAEVVKGDLQDPATVRTIFDGVDGAFMLNPVSPTEAHEGLMAVSGAKLAKLPRLVYMSVQQADRAPHLPHFGCKLGVGRGQGFGRCVDHSPPQQFPPERRVVSRRDPAVRHLSAAARQRGSVAGGRT